ncbi:MAG: hypothetical protein CMM02_05615 [Rhodopirellula sp.]|nr:hypothetical protein [Rhodopirellula sp.]|tara:strand:+ start:2135 stop:3064 length:930 start_codon:yes stop_codon:yes gene_type:complete
MNILITGGTGYLGNYLVRALDDNENNITLISREKLDNKYNNVQCDLNIQSISCETLRGIDIVYHLAAVTHDINSEKDNHDYDLLNYLATKKLASQSAKCGVKKFVYVSSIKANTPKDCKKEIINEEDEFIPDGIYGKSKRKAELALLEITESTNLNVLIIRPALIYGPELIGNLKKLEEFSKRSFLPTIPHVNSYFSMVHVKDVVSAITLIVSKDRSRFSIYQVTDGYEYNASKITKILTTENCVKKYYSFPKIFFLFVCRLGQFINFFIRIPINMHFYNKLFNGTSYSNNKIKELGFMPKFNFENRRD